MTGFPGAVYAASGRCLDRRRPDLTVEQLASYSHRDVVRKEIGAEVVRVWCLANNATFEAIPEHIQNETLEYILTGVAVLLLARRPEPLLDVREMLLASIAIHGILQRRAVEA